MKRRDFLKLIPVVAAAPSVLVSCAEEPKISRSDKDIRAADGQYEKIGRELAEHLLQNNDILIIEDADHTYGSPRQIATGAARYVAQEFGQESFFAWEYGPDFEKVVTNPQGIDVSKTKLVLASGLQEVATLPESEKQKYLDAAVAPIDHIQGAGGAIVFMDQPENNSSSLAMQNAKKTKDKAAFDKAVEARLKATQEVWSENIIGAAKGDKKGVVIGGAEHFSGEYDVEKKLTEAGLRCGVIKLEAPAEYIGPVKITDKDSHSATVILQDEVALRQITEFRRTLDKRSEPFKGATQLIAGFLESHPKCSVNSDLESILNVKITRNDAAQQLQEISEKMRKIFASDDHFFDEKLRLTCKDNASLVAANEAINAALDKALSQDRGR